MMKARQYDRFLFRHRPRTNLWSIQESNFITEELIKYAAHGDEKLEDAIRSIKADLSDAKEYGSILDVKPVDFGALIKSIEETSEAEKIGIGLGTDALEELLPLVKQAKVMAQKYDAVITNPPYMGSSNMDAALSEYVKKNYPDTKSDMSTVFMEKCLRFCSKDGFIAMLNIPVWMFLSSYEKLRKSLIEKDLFINMLHLGRGVFGSDFGTTSFVIENTSVQKYIGNYKRLFPRQGAVDTIEQKEMWFLDGFGNYIADQGDFTGIPGAPVAYWVSSKLLSIIRENRNLDSYASPRQGLITGDNNRFLRLWFEVSAIKTGFYSNKNYKWMPINKGGEFRRWYGNQEHVINWENEGAEILNYKDEYGKLRSRPQNLSYNFQESLSWSLVTSGGFSVRYYPNSFMFNVAGIACFPQKFLLYILGLLNTKITSCITQILNPTINMNAGDVAKVPVVISCPHELIICKYVSEAIDISKSDWDSFETSWDFQTHPFLAFKTDGFAEHAFDAWQTHAAEQFAQLKANEEELNRIFIDIYGLQDELSPEEEDKDVTVRRADLARDVRSFVSYGVGCILGRYSLATPGLAYAGGAWNASKYSTFMPDADNCVPITDEEYFSDDIVTRFAAFVSAAFGAETLEANLDFIARALGSKGATPRAALRNYFLNDFFKDHCKIYQKRPIYWLFDSGKENSFKALFYLHRYNADTVGNMRVEYLHPLQEKYERRLEMEKQAAEKSPSARDKAIAKAAAEKLTRQIKEIKAYDQKISHLAAARISLDLDDGVKANYEKLQTAKDAQNLEILAKIK